MAKKKKRKGKAPYGYTKSGRPKKKPGRKRGHGKKRGRKRSRKRGHRGARR